MFITCTPLAEMPTSKAKLIEATLQLMALKGFESVGIHTLLEQAGVSKSNFYYHFKSKEQLFLTALDYLCAGYEACVLHNSLLNDALASDEQLNAWFDCVYRSMAEKQCEGGCPFTNLSTETSGFFPEFQQKLSRFFLYQHELVVQCYQTGVKQGIFKPNHATVSATPAEDVASLICSSLIGSMVLAQACKRAEIILESKRQLLVFLTQ
jgi:TetR/AcrR family transcriptional repressor of nem operon